MNYLRILSPLQQLVLIVALLGGSQSMYGGLIAPFLGQPRVELFQNNRYYSMVNESIAQDKAAIDNFIQTMRNISKKPQHHY